MSANPPAGQPRRGPPPALAAALALVVVAVAVLFSIAAPALVTRFFPTTAPASATLAVYQATQTAQARLLSQPYAPTGLGPCDTADPPYTSANTAYWQWSHDPGAITCATGGVTTLTTGSYVAFYGIPGGFPRTFTATLTLAFPPGAPHACLNYGLNGATEGVTFCDDGSWQSTHFNWVTGYVPQSAHDIIAMDVTPNGAQFTINGVQATGAYPYGGSITDIAITTFTDLSPGVQIDLERFIIAPSA